VNDEYLIQNLQPIGRALIWFSRALQNDLNGRYDLAYLILKQGEEALSDWDEAQGKEVLYYFIGREALFLANCEQDASSVFTAMDGTTAVSLALDEAEKNFARAQAIARADNRTYARATSGLGQVALQRAQRKIVPAGSTTVGQCRMNPPPPGVEPRCPPRATASTDPVVLAEATALADQAIQTLDEAIAELPTPAPPRLEARVRAARASALVLKGQIDMVAMNWPSAEQSFMDATSRLAELEGSIPADDRRSRAAAFVQLGAANLGAAAARVAQNDRVGGRQPLADAVAAFDSCTRLIPIDDPDAFLRTIILPNCVCSGVTAQEALDGLK
jgi:tetratricopeptide (TPR) repeat protein